MELEGINQVLRDVFGESGKLINGWVSIRCPLARWQIEHKHGRDTRESAGISVQAQGASIFNCFTCKNKMPLQGMLRKYANATGEDLDALIEEIEEETYLGPRTLPEWGTERIDDAPKPIKAAVYLDLYEPAAGHPYLRSRGISKATANKLQLMLDPCDPADGEERILFPVFGPEGELYGLTGRATDPSARLKVRDYHGLRKAYCLLGSHLISTDKPNKILVVEGLFDYANAWQCGQPAVAVMHSTMTEHQAALLRNFSLPVYTFYDDDEAGQKGAGVAGGLLHRYLPVMKVRYPKVWIDDPTEPEGGHWLKDPGELEPDEFESMIQDARLF